MSSIAVTYSFTNGTTASGSEVNTDFNDLVTYINAQCIVKDASVAFTAVPSGPSSDPSSANHLTRKSYVDKKATVCQASTTTALDALPWNASGNRLFEIDVVDRGYDLKVWAVAAIIVSPVTASDLGNIWEIRTRYAKSTGASTVGAYSDWSGLRIPIVTAQQSLCSPTYARTFTTGATDFGTNGFARVQAAIFRAAGGQATINGFAGDARYDFLQVWSTAA